MKRFIIAAMDREQTIYDNYVELNKLSTSISDALAKYKERAGLLSY